MPINPDALKQAAERLRAARRLVVFTGAGVSAESGIPTFRDDDGFWQRFPPEQFARWDGLLKSAIIRPGQLAEFLLMNDSYSSRPATITFPVGSRG